MERKTVLGFPHWKPCTLPLRTASGVQENSGLISKKCDPSVHFHAICF